MQHALEVAQVAVSIARSCRMNVALAEGGYEQVPAEEVEGLIGGGAKVMLARAIESQGGSMADEHFRPLYKSLLRYYGNPAAVPTQPFPGVVETLDQLAAMDVKLTAARTVVSAWRICLISLAAHEHKAICARVKGVSSPLAHMLPAWASALPRYCAVQPPSMDRLAPVTCAAASLHR